MKITLIILITTLCIFFLIFSVFAEESSTSSEFSFPSFTSNFSSFKDCVGSKIKTLTKERNEKRLRLFNEYQSKLKNIASPNLKKELRKNLYKEIKNLNEWYITQVKSINKECLEFKKEELRKLLNFPSTLTTSTLR